MSAIKKPSKIEPTIDEAIKYDFKKSVDAEQQVIVHCKYAASADGDMIRIWKSTFLYARDSSHKSGLVNTQKISLYPEWTLIEAGNIFYFTLIFSGLPSSCKAFDLIENIPEPGGFFVTNINRNNIDVYNIDIG